MAISTIAALEDLAIAVARVLEVLDAEEYDAAQVAFADDGPHELSGSRSVAAEQMIEATEPELFGATLGIASYVLDIDPSEPEVVELAADFLGRAVRHRQSES